ncbi:MAG: sodium:solute symporter [Flavobacteriia bacterium]|nr:sodium:solute symporter [Flavobacteriia bacterium]
MSIGLIASVLIVYFFLLILIAKITSKGADTDTFFTAGKGSPWYLVAFGMIGASLSGVTFISVPGTVQTEGMAYFQVVLGYVLGYLVIANVLMPIYYKMNVISIYEYLKSRFGTVSYKTGAIFFILSRTLGSAMRLYLATLVLQLFLFDAIGIPYWLTAFITVALIWVYTIKGGIKTIVFTDTFQTFFLVSSLIVTVVVIANKLDLSFFSLYDQITEMTTGKHSLSKIFFFDDYQSKLFFPKQFFGGMFIAIAMTGLDQDLMQKNLTCKTLKDAKKNMYTFTIILVFVNFLFLLLGGALYLYAQKQGVELPINESGKVLTDKVFPTLALNEFGTIAGIFFLLGITASSYASADSALAALTTGFCIDFLGFKERQDEKQKSKLKLFTHLGFSLIFLCIILITYQIKAEALIGVILKIASYTYGPLLGLFAFGILSKRKLKEIYTPFVCVIIPFLCFWIDKNSITWFSGYQFSYELLILNGLLTYLGLYFISVRDKN